MDLVSFFKNFLYLLFVILLLTAGLLFYHGQFSRLGLYFVGIVYLYASPVLLTLGIIFMWVRKTLDFSFALVAVSGVVLLLGFLLCNYFQLQ